MKRFFLAIAIAVLAPQVAQAADPTGQWIVVTAPAFRKAIEPLSAQRKEQGLKVIVLETTDVLTAKQIADGDGAKLRKRVNKLCRDFKEPAMFCSSARPARRPWKVPPRKNCHRSRARLAA